MNTLIKVHRLLYTPKAIYGMLFAFRDGQMVFSCATLERPWLNNQRMESAVPAGEYPLQLEYSPKFRTRLYEVYNVPGRSEAKIHAANYAAELNGCIAVGRYHTDLNNDGLPDIASSKAALTDLHVALHGAEKSRIIIAGNGTDTFQSIPNHLISNS